MIIKDLIKYNTAKLSSGYLLILMALLLLLSASNAILQAQTNYNRYISIPQPEQPKSFVEMIFNLNESSYGTKFAQKSKDESAPEKSYRTRIEQDTSRKDNRIQSLRENPDQTKFFLYLDLMDYDQRVSVQVFNMLGKKVLDIWDDKAKPADNNYEMNVSILPNGVYLCMVVGSNFKLREKFVISKR
jgi:flagellar motor protein MotB